MFKPIDGYEKYSISEDGLVMNEIGNILKEQIKDGYYTVCLYGNGNKKWKRIHRLIAETFIPNPNNYPLVDHINNIRIDNRIENLRWINSSGNNRNREARGKYLKGVGRRKNGKSYQSHIRIDKNRVYLGSFTTEEQAHQAYLTKYNEIMEQYKC